MNKTREALPILQQALEHYQAEHTKNHVQLDSSIIAKAHMSVGKVAPLTRASPPPAAAPTARHTIPYRTAYPM